MDDARQKCNEETAYHETGHAVVGIILGRRVGEISGSGAEGFTNFKSSPDISTFSLRDLLAGNVAGWVAEELRRHELKNHVFSAFPSLESSELISARIEDNRWENIRDAVQAVENARKALNSPCDPSNMTTALTDAEAIFVLDEIRRAERRAAQILWRRWEVVRMIATELRRWGYVLGCDIIEAIGSESMKRANDE